MVIQSIGQTNTLGKIWKSTNIEKKHIPDVLYADGIWVAAAFHDGSIYSMDGKNWHQSNINHETIETISYGNGMWFAASRVGVSDYLYYSTDGKNWGKTNLTYIDRVYYANGIYVAWGKNSVYYSSDGKSWSIGTVPNDCLVWDVCYGNNIWVACGDTNIIYSSDGKSWSLVSDLEVTQYRQVKYGGGVFVVIGDNVSSSFLPMGLYYSTDGKIWTRSEGYAPSNIYYEGNMWFTSSSKYSVSGSSWIPCYNVDGSSGSGIISFDTVCYGNGRWIAKRGTDKIVYTTDPTNYFLLIDFPSTNREQDSYINSISYGDGKFVAACTNYYGCSIWVSE